MNEIESTAHALVATAQAGNHRGALLLAGERRWCVQAARMALAVTSLEHVLWMTADAPGGAWTMTAAQAHRVLGRETDAIVFDAYSGFDLDAFGAVTGTIRGGGLLVLLTPSLEALPDFCDPDYARITVTPHRPEEVSGRFLRRLVRVIADDKNVVVIEQGGGTPASSPELGVGLRPASQIAASNATGLDYQEACRTADQRQAVEAIIKVATGHRRRPVVLTSDRGRGKSAALGIAAAHLLSTAGIRRIAVTGPRLDAVAPVFEHAHRLLPGAHASRAALHFDEARLEYASPDALAQAPRAAQLLLVDEAATIPAPLLERLLERYSRIAFATTVHGYEGTGRGFAVRFQKVLDQRTPDWKALRLDTPIRWAPDDPLERFVFRALLLDARAAGDEAVAPARPDTATVEHLDRDALVADEATLAELFGLLVLAHYRTRPYDLRLLLDGLNVSVYAMRYNGHVVATALVVDEGGLDTATAREIWSGRARPHGHMIPESLAAHAGLEAAPTLRCARIMRIAVHPATRGRGLGTRLVETLVERTQAAGADYIGSSFGATDALLRFWARAQLWPVHLSVTRGATSGVHSAMVLRGLSERGRALVDVARRRFHEQLPHQLSDPLRELEPHLAMRLLRASAEAPVLSLDAQDWGDVIVFAFGRRAYEVCVAPIWKLACAALADPHPAARLTQTEQAALVLKVLQKRNWQAVAAALGLSGRAAAQDALRKALRPLVLHCGDQTVREAAERLSDLWKR